MRHLVSRLCIGLVFAVPPALVSFALAQASPARQDGQPAESPDCQACHLEYQKSWEQGSHGQALTNPDFTAAWEQQGQPKECLGCHTTGYDPATGEYHTGSVACAACHDPVPANHPLSPASMSRSAEMCGDCHRDTQFEWANSRHGESDLTCVSCHDAHGTALRAADTSALCASCHGTRVAAFAHSEHAEQGMTCTDCHITETDDELGMGNARHDHSFEVDLSTCTKCHEYEIHNADAAMLMAGDGEVTPMPPDSQSSGHPSTVSTEPQPASPIGFALFAGLIGLAAGIVLAPWLERGFRRFAGADNRREAKL